jgi:hypothetical protein
LKCGGGEEMGGANIGGGGGDGLEDAEQYCIG